MALLGPETARSKNPFAKNLYAKVRHAIPAIEWPVHAQDIDAIMTLKRTRNAVVLAHNYQTPEIFHCVADFVGDSLALAREAMTADADVIVLAGVHFMAETAKIVNPGKTVILPDLEAGCSLADSCDAKQLAKVLPKDKVIYAHCRSGGRCLVAADILKQQGYDVRPLKQGFKDLIEAGFPKGAK